MKTFIKTIFFITFFLIVLSVTACSEKEEQLPEVNNLPRYSQITAVESNSNNSNVYRIENSGLYKIGTIEDVSNIVYSFKNSVYAYSVYISKGENFNNNKIVVIKEGKVKELKDFYAAVDLKINPAGDKLAFRTFKNDSLDSAEGLRIYDINNKKYININSNVLISGGLYEWIDKNKIIYYGSIEGKKNSSNIYVYDFVNKKEEVYLDVINGYCMYFTLLNKNVLFLARQGDMDKLYYYDSKNKETKAIESNIQEIYNSIADLKNGDIYFFGTEDNKNLALYKFSSKNLKIDRITYDFPKQIDALSGIALDDEGNVYFSGIQNENEEGKKDVFMYNRREKSINLISTHEGKYSIYSSEM